jgi:Carboxypeptidase regulatory-like domain
MRLYRALFALTCILTFGSFLLTFTATKAYAQETTGGMQGTIKDGSGAVLPEATVTVSSPSLVGGRTATTDRQGNYRFTNLPPGPYVVTARAKGFTTVKRDGLILEVGHLPTIDLTMAVGGETTIVEVNAESPVIDVTSTSTQTNITEDVIDQVPHGKSFQSVIQFAPSARNEPLQGNTTTGNGTGGTSPGNGSNGGSIGYSVAGGADSENSYLVEGQETADVIGGYSHTNVPFDFIQEMQVKTSGVESEYRGSLGGTVNVIMKKGTNNWHGSVFLQFENSAMDGSPVAYSRYDPNSSTTSLTNGTTLDAGYQQYQPKKDKINDFLPGFTIGGPLWKNRIFAFAAFNPEFRNVERTVNYNGSGVATGILPFSQNTQTYYTTARVDAAATQKLHLFASWLYQGQRQAGESLPYADSTIGLTNLSASNDPSVYAHSLGYAAPNLTTNFGGDYTIKQTLVSTTRFGYFFENYHDFGYPTGGNTYLFEAAGTAASGAVDVDGNPLPSNLQQGNGFQSQALTPNFTHHNAEKHTQFDQAFSWFKSGWAGSHSFKFGYQLNRQSNDIFQGLNAPEIQVWPGQQYSFGGTQGQTNCAALVAAKGPQYGQYDSTTGALTGCSGQYGYETVYDAGTSGTATSVNNAFFVQDAWQIGRGLTISGGIRLEKEYLPAENQPAGGIARPINFGWGDKIGPRIGAAWDVFRDGKMKVFGEYGVFNDVMKLNLAISSFGGAYWNNCAYALSNTSYSALSVTPDSQGRYCPTAGGPALVTGGTPPAGLTFLENQNFRANPTTCSTCSVTEEGTAPGLKPYRQHETGFGIDYQLRPTLAFEARWDRRRLDHVIEDSALFNADTGGETFVVVNPGQGVDSTFNSFYNFLYGAAAPPCSGTDCAPNGTIPAARSYDGIELRLTKSISQHWFGMFSYTYSDLRGNYSGLTSSDVGDGGGGRNAPNNSRSFDEPFFQWSSYGKSSSGPLQTDRPNVAKGYAYYDMPWTKFGRRNTTDFGIFQSVYEGSPVTSYMDVGYAFPGGFPTFIEGRGKWVDVSQNQNTGAITTGTAYARRTPAYTQTDLNFKHTYRIKEAQAVSFDATFTNLLNQRAVTAYNSQIDSNYTPSFITPNGQNFYAAVGESAYAAYMRPYDYKSLLTTDGVIINSQYGKPYLFQSARTIRLQLHYTF